MMKTLSQRASLLKPSATLAISAKANELKAQGVDVVGFGAGEPDFPTPSRIRDAAKRSLDNGDTFYTPVGGTLELKKAIVQRFSEDYGLEYQPKDILVSCGAKHSLYNIFQAILDPGDEVLIFSPYWVSYPEMVALSGGKPVIVPTLESNGFIPGLDEVESRITASTTALVINSPSNPSGMTYPESVLRDLAGLAHKHDLLVISDEIYDKLVYDNWPVHSFATLPGMKNRSIIVNGVSKTYAMTGFRIGYMACTIPEIVKAATDLQSQSTSNPTSTAQAAAVEALSGPQEDVVQMREIFERRRNFMVDEINKIPGLSCLKPGGAFYVFVNITGFLGKHGINNSSDFSKYLLERHAVATVPGGPFGSDEHIRLSFTVSEEVIAKGLERIREMCAALS